MEMEDKMDEHKVKNAAQTLMEAEEIKANKGLMKHVHKHMKHKSKAIKSIQDLKDAAAAMDHDDDDDMA